jgi:hypothetical protein
MHNDLCELVPQLEGTNSALLYGGLEGGPEQLTHMVDQLGRTLYTSYHFGRNIQSHI